VTQRVTTFLKLILIVLAIYGGPLFAVSTLYHIPPTSPILGEPIKIEAIVLGDEVVEEAILYHRTVGQTGYHELRMIFQAGSWKANVSSEFVTSYGLEYALIFFLQDGSSLAFPRDNPLDSPHRLVIGTGSDRERRSVEGRGLADTQLSSNILIITPEDGQIIQLTDALIVASFFNTRSLDENSVTLFLDNRDVTSEAVISPEILTYSTAFLESGLHTVRIESRNTFGYEFQPVSWSFVIAGEESGIVTAADEFKYNGRVRTDLSLDRVDDLPRSIGQTITRFEGGWPWLNFKTDVRVTTDESIYRQPRNRLSTTLMSGKTITLNFGDFTPVLSPYTVDGKRIRGLGIDVNLNWIRFQSVTGEVERAVQGLPDMDRAYVVTDIEVDSVNGKLAPLYILDRRGYTFKRNIRSFRLLLNHKNRLQMGLNFLKAKDDISSVTRVLEDAKFWVPYDTLLIDTQISQIDSGIYSFKEFKKEIEGIANYELATMKWGGDDPYDNVVFGFDGGLAVDDRRIIFETAWAMSLLNRNIWDEPFTREELDTLSFLEDTLMDGRISGQVEIPFDPKDLKDFMVVNQNMTPLVPIDLDALSKTPIAAIMNMPSAAYKFRMRAYYYNNTFQLQYSQVGPEFKSLANPYLSSNLREFTISDRVRLIENRMSVNFDYRHRDNSILKTVVDEYSQNSLSTSFTFAPGFDLPTFSSSFQTVTRGNSKTGLDTLVTGVGSFSLEDRRENTRTRNQVFSINLPWRYNDLILNTLGTFSSVNVSDLLEAERAADYGSPNMNSQSYSLVTTIKYTFPLRIAFNVSGYSVQLSERISADRSKTRLTNMGVDVTYDTWNNRLNVKGGLSYSKATGISDFSFYGARGGVQFKPIRNFFTRLTASVKIRQTEEEVNLGTLAVKFSANYVF